MEADVSETEPEDIRQVIAVTKLLGNKLNMKVAKFTSDETIDERKIITEYFKDGETLQALVAIKCLDEGVNIPSIKTAFILASTTNPKEYIQRRGRVLRKSQETGKEYAEIYDFITLPRPLEDVTSLTLEEAKRDLSLVKKELIRIKEFSRLCINPVAANKIIWEIYDSYGLTDEFVEGKEDLYEC